MKNGYSVAKPDQAADWMAEYEGFGRMLSFTQALGSERVALTWRQMPAGTGGRGSYGHRHPDQEEIFLVVKGTITFKCDDDEFEAGPGTAVRIGPDVYRSVHNDSGEEAELVIVSNVDPEQKTERKDDFWPEEAA